VGIEVASQDTPREGENTTAIKLMIITLTIDAIADGIALAASSYSMVDVETE
jgi:hypothetical protein